MLALNALTFWLGFLLLGLTLVIAPPVLPAGAWLPMAAGSAAGVACLAVVAAYVALVFTRRASFSIRGSEFTLPRPAMACVQIALSAVD